MSKDRKLGRFWVSYEVLRRVADGDKDAAAEWSAVFSRAVIFEAVHRFDRNAVEYLAYCDDFTPVPECSEARNYTVGIHRHEGFIGAERVVTYDAVFTPQ